MYETPTNPTHHSSPWPALAECHSYVDFNVWFPHILNFNPLPDVPILGSSNSAANKDMMSKTWTKGDTVI